MTGGDAAIFLFGRFVQAGVEACLLIRLHDVGRLPVNTGFFAGLLFFF